MNQENFDFNNENENLSAEEQPFSAERLYENEYYKEFIIEREKKRKVKRIAAITGGAFLAEEAFVLILNLLLSLFVTIFRSNEVVAPILFDPITENVLEIIFSICAFTLPFIVVFKIGKEKISEIVSLKKPKKENLLPLVLFGIGFCSFSNVATSVAGSFFTGLGFEYDASFIEGPNGVVSAVLLVISVAIVPPLVEEFALRGIVLGSMRKFGDAFAIIVSAVLFGIMHGNFEQMPFAFLTGLALGFIAVKSGSLWPAIFVHAWNNASSLFFTFGMNALSDRVQNTIYVLYLAVSMFAAVFALTLVKNGQEFFSLEKGEEDIKFSEKLKYFFLSAPIIVYVVLLFAQMFKYFV